VRSKSDKALKIAAGTWFLFAIIGQWMFVLYITMHYGGTAISGDYARIGPTTITGVKDNDLFGNLMFAGHIVMGAIVTFGGAMQLIPWLRSSAISFHRWNGRIFLITAVLLSVGSLYLLWIRESYFTLYGATGGSLNALLVIGCGYLAYHYIRGGNITAHRRWALRTYIAMNGVWFFRVGIMIWIIINQSPAGMTEKLDGPFDIFMAFANFAVPLLILEVYLRVSENGGPRAKTAMAIALAIITLMMGAGIAAVIAFMWLPHF